MRSRGVHGLLSGQYYGRAFRGGISTAHPRQHRTHSNSAIDGPRATICASVPQPSQEIAASTRALADSAGGLGGDGLLICAAHWGWLIHSSRIEDPATPEDSLAVRRSQPRMPSKARPGPGGPSSSRTGDQRLARANVHDHLGPLVWVAGPLVRHVQMARRRRRSFCHAHTKPLAARATRTPVSVGALAAISTASP